LQWLVAGLILSGWAMGFDFSAGYINVVNFGYAAFAASGGYAAGLLGSKLGINPWLNLLAGVAVAAAIGAGAGIFTLRFRGLYASVAAWFIGLALQGICTNLRSFTGGSIGLSVPTLFTGSGYMSYYYVALALVAVTFVILRLVVDSRMGLAFRALGENLDAARSSGITPVRYRLFNFTVGCAVAGLFGAFYAHFYGVLTPNLFSVSQTIPILVVVFLAGKGSLIGPALFALPFTFFNQWLSTNFTSLPGIGLLVYGAVLVIVMTLYPAGLTGALAAGWNWLAKKRRRPSARSAGPMSPAKTPAVPTSGSA
jgi:branched-chain amino acid transport system permease protein